MGRAFEELKNEREIYISNRQEIAKEQRRITRRLLPFFTVLVSVLAILSWCVKPLAPGKMSYLIGAVILIIMLLVFKKVTKPGAISIFTYTFCTVILALSICISMALGEDAMSVTYITIACVMPVAILDLTERKSVFFFVAWIVHAALAIAMKRNILMWENIVISFGASLIGLFISYSTQRSKLMYIDMYNKSDYDKRHDFLTGMFNRWELFELIKQSLEGKEKQIESMFMVDIDNFKGYNDIYGHIAGDECLRKISRTYVDIGKKYDIRFFRYGGEEILGVGLSDKVPAEEIAGEMVRAVEQLKMSHSGLPGGVVTVSLGYTTDNSRYEKMISNADSAMYSAKNSGKNRAVCFEKMDK